MIKNIILGVFILLCVAGLFYLFSTPVSTTKCANGILKCLEKNATLPFWDKMGQGFVCLYDNLLCVIKQ